MINLSFATGIYTTKVIPIFKNKGDQLIVSNYRHISLLSDVNKIFEKIVYKLFSFFLDRLSCNINLGFDLNILLIMHYLMMGLWCNG